MYFEWVKYLVVALVVVGLGWLAYEHFLGGHGDGERCERDRDCPGRVCLLDARGRFCTRTCEADEGCLEGWRCLRPVERRGLHCVRPAAP